MEDLFIQRRNEPIPGNVNLQKEEASLHVLHQSYDLCLHFRRSRRSLLKYGAVLLLGVGSLMAGATTGVPMSPAHDPKYYNTKSPDNASALLHNEVNIHTEAPKNYTTELSAPAYYTDALKYYSSSYYKTEAPVYYTKATEYYTTTKCY
ncbi:hypothetical protein DAPPUDRAFT_255627 [Daphnia pulex]|uniref:Uncharacterized protein n=1 Tax=Daphnia pulex TaxID=6669 RepID=E9H9R3_DAPPU|nr:hypothetical protein DAPPUDRAFT_255620 [Daphnia pulex]EFX71565.1 hypothetical protein DAPPUDRAFT_255627 [Daphnia pulex]|eukprot:EFX71446.1 hypothetical protein DAPPUDRAFT_255620 [Daphnia pulex]